MDDTIRLVELPARDDARGGLVFMEAEAQVPFPIRRFFFIHHVAPSAGRASHAHRACRQFLIALAGSMIVELDDGRARRRERLDRPTQGLYVPPMVWVEVTDFSADGVLGVLASHPYDESDYIRDRKVFDAATGQGA